MVGSNPIVIYANLLLSSEERLKQLKVIAPSWLRYWNCPALIRVRGEYAEEAANFLRKFPKVSTKVGQVARSWRMQAFMDLCTVDAIYVFILFEDHMLSERARDGSNIICDLFENGCDVYQYSWFASYAPLRQWQQEQPITTQTETSIFTEIDYHLARKAYESTALYLLSLSSIFRRTFLLSCLRSPLPIFRRFDPAGPFDIEAKIPRKRLLPIRYGQSRQEFGLCLDDDHLIAGSSGMARGFIDPSLIAANQHQHLSSRSLFEMSKSKLANASKRSNKGRIVLRITLRLDWIINSILSLTYYVADSIRLIMTRCRNHPCQETTH